ncbi:MAG: glutathione S-transferase family protein [Pseudomonadota bacterium]
MTPTNFEETVLAANRQLGDNPRHRTVGSVTGRPRFELYHSAPSLCSHKVRTTLAERGVPYRSHDLNIMLAGRALPENYHPSYVRMRLLGKDDRAFVSAYSGQSSVATEGLDACVVPTLVDHEQQRVVVDSSEICKYVDRCWEADGRLIRDGMEDAVQAQLDIIDRAPHVAALYGANPDGDRRPGDMPRVLRGVQDKKIKTLRRVMRGLDPKDPLLAAYESKIAKESGSKTFVNTPEAMRDTYAAMRAHAKDLESQLATHDGEWALGAEFTLADVVWACSLFRLKWLGLGDTFEGNPETPRVDEYAQRSFARPAFRQAVVDWPSAYGPCDYIPEYAGPANQKRLKRELLKRFSPLKIVFG